MYITNVLVILFGSIACAVVSLDSNSRPVNPKTPALVNRRNGLIGAGIVSAIGFKYYMDGPVFKEMVDLKGYNVVITGANTGLGKEAAIKLAELGANVYILVRSLEKGQIVCDELRKTSAVGQQIEALSLDLSSLRSVEECAKAITSKLGSTGIDILMNNAGVMAIPQRETTKDGFEAHMGINHLGHFALTSLLFPLLKKGGKGKGARIINISSAAHMLGKLDFNNLMLEKEGTYQPWPAYGNSKLANILFTKELNRRLRSKGSDIITTACHPGGCRTELGRYIFDPESIPKFLYPVLGAPIVYLTKSAKQGAQTQIYLAASSKIALPSSGLYFDNSSPTKVTDEAADADEAARFWTASEKFIGKSFDV